MFFALLLIFASPAMGDDIDYVESKLIITFGNNTSYNFFRLSMLNDVSKRKIEKIFKSIYGEEVTITIRKLTKGQKVDKREI